MSIVEVRCDAIHVGERHRKDLGEIEVLAASIATEGLLQPIGITEENVLVFGERRLRAFQDVLRLETIPARVVHVRSITAGEYAENEIRKDFTLSERDAIRRAIEAQIPERRGSQNPDNCPELKGEETRQISARKAGFSNYRAAERVAKVVDNGNPELVAAMDSGEVSISAASVIAAEPPELQSQIVQMPRELRRKVVREIREAAKLPTPSEARRIARETGMSVADNTGVYRSGSSPEDVRLAKADMRAIYDATRGVVAIADTTLDPNELASRLEYWHCPGIREKSTKALDWLNRFVKGLENNEQIQ
jgi:hypothetical protein